MYDANKIKTFTPILPIGTGPTSTHIEDSIHDIVVDLDENNNMGCNLTSDELDIFIENLIAILGIKEWIDGEYELFEDYKIRIETMPKSKFDEMHEFEGY